VVRDRGEVVVNGGLRAMHGGRAVADGGLGDGVDGALGEGVDDGFGDDDGLDRRLRRGRREIGRGRGRRRNDAVAAGDRRALPAREACRRCGGRPRRATGSVSGRECCERGAGDERQPSAQASAVRYRSGPVRTCCGTFAYCRSDRHGVESCLAFRPLPLPLPLPLRG
jgi:hypothetical protein